MKEKHFCPRRMIMIESRIEFSNGRVPLYIGGVRLPACAYITYLDERSHCDDFAKAGIEIYSLCASFSGLPRKSNEPCGSARETRYIQH